MRNTEKKFETKPEIKVDLKEHKVAKPKAKSPTRPIEIEKEEVKWDGKEHKI